MDKAHRAEEIGLLCASFDATGLNYASACDCLITSSLQGGKSQSQAEHAFAVAFLLEFSRAGAKQIRKRNHPDKLQGVLSIDHRHASQSCLGHSINHQTQRFIRKCRHDIPLHRFSESHTALLNALDVLARNDGSEMPF